MKNKVPIVVFAVAVVVVVAVLMSRPGSDSEATHADENGVESSMTALPARELFAEKGADVSSSERPSNILRKLEAIQQDSDYKERPGMLFDLMFEASMDEVLELLALSEDQQTYSLGFRDSMKVAAYERWYHVEPVAALLAMDASTLSSSQKNSRMEVFLQDWAEQAPQEVAAFLDQLTGVSSDLTVGALVRGSALNGNLAITDAALARMDDPKLRYYALKSAARVLQRDHADLFEGWLSKLPAADQNTALAESAWMLADQEMARALLGLKRLEDRGADEFAVTRSRIVVKWTRNDPTRAAAWVVEQESSGEEREELFSTFLRVWMHEDRSAATAWAEDLIDHGEIDDAFMNRVISLM